MMAGICINRIMGEILSRRIGVFLLGRQPSKDIRLRRRGVVRRVVHLLPRSALLPFLGWSFPQFWDEKGWLRWESERSNKEREVKGESEKVGVCGE